MLDARIGAVSAGVIFIVVWVSVSLLRGIWIDGDILMSARPGVGEVSSVVNGGSGVSFVICSTTIAALAALLSLFDIMAVARVLGTDLTIFAVFRSLTC